MVLRLKERIRQLRAALNGTDDLEPIALIPHDWEGMEFEPEDDDLYELPPGYEWVDDA